MWGVGCPVLTLSSEGSSKWRRRETPTLADKLREETEKEEANCCLSYFSTREFPHKQVFKMGLKLQHTASNTSLCLVMYWQESVSSPFDSFCWIILCRLVNRDWTIPVLMKYNLFYHTIKKAWELHLKTKDVTIYCKHTFLSWLSWCWFVWRMSSGFGVVFLKLINNWLYLTVTVGHKRNLSNKCVCVLTACEVITEKVVKLFITYQ